MNPKNLILFDDTNVSRCWARIFLESLARPKGEIVPVLLTIRGLGEEVPIEISGIRQLLDKDLAAKGKFLSSTVASTIFPISMWNPKLNRQELFDRYLGTLKQLKKCKQNHKGIYFERLLKHGPTECNQLDFFLRSRLENGNHRRSVLQAAIVDPIKDLTNQPVRGFPCLQQVSFVPFGDGELAVNGFYGSQYVYEKAYGNYIGLINLGRFIAHEMKLRLTQLNCFTGIATLGVPKKAWKTSQEKSGRSLVKWVRNKVYLHSNRLLAEMDNHLRQLFGLCPFSANQLDDTLCRNCIDSTCSGYSN